MNALSMTDAAFSKYLTAWALSFSPVCIGTQVFDGFVPVAEIKFADAGIEKCRFACLAAVLVDNLGESENVSVSVQGYFVFPVAEIGFSRIHLAESFLPGRQIAVFVINENTCADQDYHSY